MKKLLTVLFLTIVTLCSFGQSQNPSTFKGVKYKDNVDTPLTTKELSMIKEVYQESAQNEVLSRPMVVKRIKHLLRNRFRVIKVDIKAKQKPCTLLSQVELFNHYNKNLQRDNTFDESNFNPLKYNFDFYAAIPQIYRVDGTNYYIQIKSQFQE